VRDEVTIVSREVLSQQWGTLSRYVIETRSRTGERQQHMREVYDHGHAAGILLCDPERGTVILIRQYRLPVQLGGDDPALVEVCAGLLDGDDPETCARKEAEEETGYRPQTVTHVVDAYLSPGSLTERVSLFLGTYSPAARISEGGGLAHEGEDIEVLEMPFETALGMVRSGAIIDAKTILLLQHAELGGVFRRDDGAGAQA
jgi:GDP-mannose pyrophosphatase NudK